MVLHVTLASWLMLSGMGWPRPLMHGLWAAGGSIWTAERQPSRQSQLLMLQEAGLALFSASPSSLAVARCTVSSPHRPPDDCGGQSLALVVPFKMSLLCLQVILPDGYLAAVYEEMRAEGAACIADEVHLTFFSSVSVTSD